MLSIAIHMLQYIIMFYLFSTANYVPDGKLCQHLFSFQSVYLTSIIFIAANCI